MRIEIESAQAEAELWHVALLMTTDGGATTRIRHTFPQDTMEWRAAEYDIDPADTATLLDVVIAEPHLTAEDLATGSLLHDAPDIPTARRDHLTRCAAVKLRHRISTRAKGSPLDQVRTQSPMAPEVIEVKRDHVDRVREQHAQQRRLSLSTGGTTGAARAEALRARLYPPDAFVTKPRPEEDQ